MFFLPSRLHLRHWSFFQPFGQTRVVLHSGVQGPQCGEGGEIQTLQGAQGAHHPKVSVRDLE